MGVPSHLVTIRGQMVLREYGSIVLFKCWHFELGRYDHIRDKHSSLGSTLLRSFTPSISFSFLSRKLHLCCMSTCFDRPNGFFLNFPYSQGSSEFGSMDGSMPPFQDAGSLCKQGSLVIPFPFVKLVTIFVIWAIFSCISCCPLSSSSILRVFPLFMSS